MTDLQALSDAASEDVCPKPGRVDGPGHSWRFDGDSPIVFCHFCGERRDALTGRPLQAATPVVPAEGLREALAWMATERGEVRMTFDRFIEALTQSGVRLAASPSPDTDSEGPMREALIDGALPAMRYAANRLGVLGDRKAATDLTADAAKIARLLETDPSPDTDAGLDVERLARAIEQHRTGKWYDPVLKTDFEEAEGVAAEYARLATPDKEQPETSDG